VKDPTPMASHLERIRRLVGHQLLGAPSVSVAIRDPWCSW
jgi:hypothetical protein